MRIFFNRKEEKMKRRELEDAMSEADRFLIAGNRLMQAFHIASIEGGPVNTKDMAACRRASLDLTRALADLRR